MANRAELELLGYTQEEDIGRHIAEFHADAYVIRDILARLKRGEELHDYEARLRCKDSSIRSVLISSNLHWEDGRFIHTRCFTRDITDRKQADREREQSRRRQAIDKAQAALEAAEREHEREAAALEVERADIEKRSQSEKQRWEAQRKKLMSALSRARD